MSISSCIRKALGSVGAYVTDWDTKKEKTEEPGAPEVDPTEAKRKARESLAAAGCLGRKRPPIFGLIMLSALLVAAIWVELHLLAAFIGIALALTLMSYFMIQKWIDILGDDHEGPEIPTTPPDPSGEPAYSGA
jgi:hypothetical protein